MIKFPIYLDNHSTTKVDPRVLEAMLPYFTEFYGNASSKSHEFGWKAEAAVEFARKQCARLVNCEPRDIIFTSGATESINLALKGAAEANAVKGDHIITSLIEHEAVLDTCKNLESKGFRVTYLPVDEFGLVSPETMENAITPQTILVSIMWVNNEIGTIQPIQELSEICREKKVLFHTDATQAVGKLPIDLASMNIDMMSFSSHKIYGPKGAGALYKKGKIPRVRITAQLDGGAQEKGLRAGTLNVPGIVGFGKACEIAMADMESDQIRIKQLRDRLYEGLVSGIKSMKLNGHPEKRINGNLNISISNIDADSLMISVKDIAVSTGSACSSESVEPSHVLTAIGIDNKLKRSTIRFGVGKYNTTEEIDFAIAKVTEKVKYLFSIMPEAKRNMKGDHASV